MTSDFAIGPVPDRLYSYHLFIFAQSETIFHLLITTVTAISQPSGYVSNNSDCNDNNAAIHPGATEIKNDGIDQDCDGQDEYVSVTIPFADTPFVSGHYVTQDFIPAGNDMGKVGDIYIFTSGYPVQFHNGYGWVDYETPYSQGVTLSNTSVSYDTSSLASGTVIYIGYGVGPTNTAMTMNSNSTFVPAYTTVSQGNSTWYADNDGDGYGDPNNPTTQSYQPSGYVADNSDCDDYNPGVYPGATEIAGDGIDQDCDGIESPSSSNPTGLDQISLLSPSNNESLGFGSSGGTVAFSFSKVANANKYILYISLNDILNDSGFNISVELIPPGSDSGGNDPWSSGDASSTPGFFETFIGMVYELSLDAATWDILALYNIEWGVEAFDVTGTLIGSTYMGSAAKKYVNALKFIASNSITMISPINGESLSKTDDAPTFKWDTYSGVNNYTVILAHVGSLGFDNVITQDYLTLNLFPMDDPTWQSMSAGTWYWTVFGYDASGTQTPNDFTIFDFEVQ